MSEELASAQDAARRMLVQVRRARERRRRVAQANPLRHPAQFIAFGFVAMVAIGTLLLMLPVASEPAGSANLRTALFTAVSAGCVTGLTVVETASYWTPFGHVVLLALMQLGGLGVVAFASLLGLLVDGRLGLRSRLLAQAETKTFDLGTVRRVLRGIVLISLTIEAVVWLLLTLRLWLGYDLGFGQAVYQGLFHAISAYNNAGFVLWSGSLMDFTGDPLIVLPIAGAIILGGVGYPVLLELSRQRRYRWWSLHTRLTLAVTGILLVAGPLIIVISEWRNPSTLAHLPWWERAWAGWFGGITPRSAGFNTFDYASAEQETLFATDLLMIIGGGSAGTSGGLKVTTIAVLTLAVAAEMRGDQEVNAFGRRIASATVRQALAVAMLAIAAVCIGTYLMLMLTELSLHAALFEVLSAFTTCGLSIGVTGALPFEGEVVLMVLMFLGRVGPITLATAIALRQRGQAYRNPEARPIVG